MDKEKDFNDTEMLEHIEKRQKRINELKKEKQYSKKNTNFYEKGILIIKGRKIPITKLNVVEDQNHNYFVDIVDKICILPHDTKIQKVIPFRDTSLFPQLLKKYQDKISENTITVEEEDIDWLISLIWDGKYHNLTPEAEYLQEIYS